MKGIKVFIAASANEELKSWIANKGCLIEDVHTEGIVSGPLSDHPDMFMCKLGADDSAPLIRPPDISVLRDVYPYDVCYNAACTGKYLIHNLRYTSPDLLRVAGEMRMKLVNTRQGYAKCSTVVIDENSIITYDRGIERACRDAGVEVLLVQPGYVRLPGYNTGFIGGASGRIGDSIVFNGNLEEHPDHERIVDFIGAMGLRVKWFRDWPLTDIGSILSCQLD